MCIFLKSYSPTFPLRPHTAAPPPPPHLPQDSPLTGIMISLIGAQPVLQYVILVIPLPSQNTPTVEVQYVRIKHYIKYPFAFGSGRPWAWRALQTVRLATGGPSLFYFTTFMSLNAIIFDFRMGLFLVELFTVLYAPSYALYAAYMSFMDVLMQK